LKDNGVKDVPSSTPSSASKYRELENKALGFADKRKMKPAEFDLSVWREYSGNTVSAVTGESYDADLRKAL
jgi:thermostable 8-oxoguanine DNA glycosylase